MEKQHFHSEMPAHVSIQVPHHVAQIWLAQHWLADLHKIDPRSSANPGTSSITITTHASLSMMHHPHVFPCTKGCWESSDQEECCVALLCCLKAYLWVKEGKWCQVRLTMTVCVWLHLTTTNLCLHIRAPTAFKRSPPWFHAFLKECLPHHPLQELFSPFTFSTPPRSGWAPEEAGTWHSLGKTSCLPRTSSAEPQAASPCAISPSELIFSEVKLHRSLCKPQPMLATWRGHQKYLEDMNLCFTWAF